MSKLNKIFKIMQSVTCSKTGSEHKFGKTYEDEQLICKNCGKIKFMEPRFKFFVRIVEKEEPQKEKCGKYGRKKKKIIDHNPLQTSAVIKIKKISKEKSVFQRFNEKYEILYTRKFYDKHILKVNRVFNYFPSTPTTTGNPSTSTTKKYADNKKIYKVVFSKLVNELFAFSFNICFFLFGCKKRMSFVTDKKFEKEKFGGLVSLILNKIISKSNIITNSRKNDFEICLKISIVDTFENKMYDLFSNYEKTTFEKLIYRDLTLKELPGIIQLIENKLLKDKSSDKIILIKVIKFDETLILLNNVVSLFYINNLEILSSFKNSSLTWMYKNIDSSKNTRTIFLSGLNLKDISSAEENIKTTVELKSKLCKVLNSF